MYCGTIEAIENSWGKFPKEMIGGTTACKEIPFIMHLTDIIMDAVNNLFVNHQLYFYIQNIIMYYKAHKWTPYGYDFTCSLTERMVPISLHAGSNAKEIIWANIEHLNPIWQTWQRPTTSLLT